MFQNENPFQERAPAYLTQRCQLQCRRGTIRRRPMEVYWTRQTNQIPIEGSCSKLGALVAELSQRGTENSNFTTADGRVELACLGCFGGY
jgi:hypothetical protein